MPPGRKSIRHIPLPGNRKLPVLEREKTVEKTVPEKPRRNRKGKHTLWIISIASLLVLVAAIWAVTWLFASATVTVTPRQAVATVNTVLETGKIVPGDLPSTVVTSTSTVSELIASTREEMVSRKASGQIVIYNNFSSEPQRLIKNTRFESADGHIYRIDVSVVVPGQKVEGGKKVPGSIKATVYADAAGPEYNLPLSSLKGDFTIPGFKGSPRYEAFFARQMTDITGGFSGIARIVDDSVLESVESRLQSQAEETLWNNIVASLPLGFTAFKSLSVTDFSTETADNASGDGVKITVTAVGKAVGFDASLLSHILAEASLTDYGEEPVLIQNLSDLEVLPKTSTANNPFEEDPLTFSVKGNAHFVWQFDQEDFKANLMGKSKKETESVMRNYTAIKTAEVVIKPSWVSTYPSKEKKIVIVLKLD